MCKEYIHSKFSDVTDADITIYEDEGFSAKNTDRPQFQQMLRDIKLKSRILWSVTGLTVSAAM